MAKQPEKFVTISCKAPQSINTRLERLAKRTRRSKSAQMVLLLEEALKRASTADGKVA